MTNTDHVIPLKNIVFSEITADLSSSATSITVKTGEGALFEEGMIATIEQLDSAGKATAREVVLIDSITDDSLTITRGYATCVMDDTANPKVVGNTAQSFTNGAKISVYISKGVLNAMQEVLPTSKTYNTCVYNQSVALKNCVLNSCDDWWDALYKEKSKRCYNDCGFGDGSDGDCIISSNAFLDASCEYNFKNLTICENVLVRFCGAGTPRINVQKKFCNMGTIDLRGGTFVGACSRVDGFTGCTVSNNACQTAYNSLCFGCGGSGGILSGCRGCDATNGAGGDGGCGGTTGRGLPGGCASGYDGGVGGQGAYSYSGEISGGGGGGGGGYWTGNGGNGGKGGDSYKGTLCSNGGDGGNGGIWGRGGDGGNGGDSSNSSTSTVCASGGNGGNGYIGGNGGSGGNYSGNRVGADRLCAGCGGHGIICGGDAGYSYNSPATGKNGGNAINNMYGLIIHACAFHNNCIMAKGGNGGHGGNVFGFESYSRKQAGNGGCGANGGKVSIGYVYLCNQGSINTSAGNGGCGGGSYGGPAGTDGANGTDGWYKTCKPF